MHSDGVKETPGCAGEDLNLHGLKRPPGPQPGASTNSATSARPHSSDRPSPPGRRLLEELEERDRVEEEERRDDHGQPCQVPLDDVRAALRGRGEPHATEAGVAPGVHEDEPDQAGGEHNLDDCEQGDHGSRLADVPADDARERIQKLLVTGDNRLKQGVAPEKVRESYEQALEVARGRPRGRRAAAR